MLLQGRVRRRLAPHSGRGESDMAAPAAATVAELGGHVPGGMRTVTLAALGVAYGDIGTSPLYTIREAFGHAGGLQLGEAAVLGVLSLVLPLIGLATLATHHRQPSGDLGRVLADRTGDPARPPVADDRAPHLGRRAR